MTLGDDDARDPRLPFGIEEHDGPVQCGNLEIYDVTILTHTHTIAEDDDRFRERLRVDIEPLVLDITERSVHIRANPLSAFREVKASDIMGSIVVAGADNGRNRRPRTKHRMSDVHNEHKMAVRSERNIRNIDSKCNVDITHLGIDFHFQITVDALVPRHHVLLAHALGHNTQFPVRYTLDFRVALVVPSLEDNNKLLNMYVVLVGRLLPNGAHGSCNG